MNTNPKNSAQFGQYFATYQERINSLLATILPDNGEIPEHLHQAMRYVVLNGGKRIRPLLVYATGEALGLEPSVLDLPAAAIELIHCYSLVHDDLPAMDDDDLRRGNPTCHKAFDEATAILVGDALQTLAFEILSWDSNKIAPTIRLQMINTLARASGSLGMVGGQALDLRATGNRLALNQLKLLHQLKTGALISAAIQLGLLASSTEDGQLMQCLTQFATKIGLCFQIQDDILNSEGSPEVLGKSIGTDQAKQKATFVTLEGIANAKHRLNLYFQEAMDALAPYSDALQHLSLLAEYIVARDR